MNNVAKEILDCLRNSRGVTDGQIAWFINRPVASVRRTRLQMEHQGKVHLYSGTGGAGDPYRWMAAKGCQ